MQYFRSLQFLCLGYFEFTAPGFARHRQNFQQGALDKNLSGKHYVITGGNAGLGAATAQQLAQRGGHVHLVCRNLERAEAAKKKIEDDTGRKDVCTLHICDMSVMGDVHKLGRRFVEEGQRIDVVINNVGVMMSGGFEESSEGVEKGLATNVLSGFVLTEVVREELERRKGRAILVSSGGMLTKDLVVDDLEGRGLMERGQWEGLGAYAKNKRQQVALGEYWAKKYEGNGVLYGSTHPGWCATTGVQTTMPAFYERLKGRLRNVDEGADTIVWLAISDEAMQYPSGSFFFDRSSAPKHLPFGGTQYAAEKRDLLIESMKKLLKDKCGLQL